MHTVYLYIYILQTLRAGRSGDRIPVGERFSAPVQTGPGAHPASCTMGTGSFLQGVKRSRRGVDHPPPSSAEVEGRVELYICSPSGPPWPLTGRTLTLPYIFYKTSPTCFGVLYTILRENFEYLIRTVTFLQSYYIRCVIKYKIHNFL